MKRSPIDSVLNKRRNIGERILFIVAFVIFLIYALSIFGFFGWSFLCSFMTNDEFFENPCQWPSEIFTGDNFFLDNYLLAFKELEYNNVNFVLMLFNSIWFALGSAFLSTFTHAVTGYVFAKYNFKGKSVLEAIIIFTMIIPIVGSLPSSFALINNLGLTNSPLFLLTSLGGFGTNFLITLAFFKSIDDAYKEAAMIDGANHFTIFFKIMLPMAIPPLVAIGILSVIGSWNDYLTPILYLDEMPTLSSGLYVFRQEQSYNINQPVYFAGVIMSMIPVIILFALSSKKIMTNVVVGGIKG